MQTPLSRYRELVSDWAAFQAAAESALPPCVVVHPQRIGRSELKDVFGWSGLQSEPVAWHGHALRLPPAEQPGRHWGYLAGLYQIQEEAALVPVRLLDPQPGEAVLDLCAAPGNKTANIAHAMGGTGTVIANEPVPDRLGALRRTVRRLGLVNVSVTRHRGQVFPREAGPFDRVLVDAPCSGEGTSRRRPATIVSDQWRRRQQARQVALLNRAISLTRVGGRIVYATCTYAPEENEAVIAQAMKTFGTGIRVRTVDISGLVLDAGIAAWEGQTYPADLRRAVRLWPHRNDTGGFFCAVLERSAGQDPAARVRMRPLTSTAPAAAPWLNRFRLPGEELARVREAGRRGKYAWIAARDHVPPAACQAVQTGLPVTATGCKPPKPTTAGALHWGRQVEACRLPLEAQQAYAFLHREPVAVSRSATAADDGYVIVTYAGHPLGVGFLSGTGSRLRLASLYPKAWVPRHDLRLGST